MGDTIVHFKEQIQEFHVTHYHDYCDIDSRKSKKVNWAYLKKERVDVDSFIKNYGNLLKKVESNRLTVVIEETDLKLSLKVFITKRKRVAGNRFFIVRKSFKGITYNKKTKNFYVIENNRKDKQIIKSLIRTNYFGFFVLRELNNYINISKKPIQNSFNTNKTETVIYRFLEVLYSTIGKNNDEYLTTDESLFKFYLEVNNIKYPNTFHQFRHLKMEKQKLKQVGNLVKYFMKTYNLKGDYVVKILNTNERIDFFYLIYLFHLLGVDYFNKLNFSIFNSPFIIDNTKVYEYEKFLINLTNTDKKRIVSLINSLDSPQLVFSHLNMIKELEEKYGEKWKMKFNDYQSFDIEHYRLSETIQSYKKGFVIRDYGVEFKKEIEQPIYSIDGVDYYPCLLLDSNNYNDESIIQHNCVRTYIEKSSCFIISLRMGDYFSKNRVTIEYQIRKNKILRVQTRTKHNKDVEGQLWNIALNILDDRINFLYKNKVFKLPTMTIQYKNKQPISKITIFDSESLIPFWEGETNPIQSEIEQIDFFENLFE